MSHTEWDWWWWGWGDNLERSQGGFFFFNPPPLKIKKAYFQQVSADHDVPILKQSWLLLIGLDTTNSWVGFYHNIFL